MAIGRSLPTGCVPPGDRGVLTRPAIGRDGSLGNTLEALVDSCRDLVEPRVEVRSDRARLCVVAHDHPCRPADPSLSSGGRNGRSHATQDFSVRSLRAPQRDIKQRRSELVPVEHEIAGRSSLSHEGRLAAARRSCDYAYIRGVRSSSDASSDVASGLLVVMLATERLKVCGVMDAAAFRLRHDVIDAVRGRGLAQRQAHATQRLGQSRRDRQPIPRLRVRASLCPD